MKNRLRLINKIINRKREDLAHIRQEIKDCEKEIEGLVVEFFLIYDNILKPRELKILMMRYGIEPEKKHTFKELEKEFFITRARIRQIERKTIEKLMDLVSNSTDLNTIKNNN